MRNAIAFLCPCLMLFATACGPTHVVVQTEAPAPAPPPPPSPAPEISYQTFYDALSPYGQWVNYPGAGYVWIPNVGPDFKPYGSGGHWVYSDDGWTWVSDYSWGWAPFHYGRWFFDDEYGWCWVPGYQWAPAWVSWRRSPDYYGWAPLGPTVGVSVSIEAYNPPPHVWCFVPQQYVTSPRINNYYVQENQNVTIINRTTVINNYHTTVINNTTVNNTVINNTTVNNTNIVNNRNVFVGGPPRAEVEAVTHTTIRPITFREGSRPGATQENNGQLTIYRPPVRTPATSGASGGGQAAPAPARVTPLNNVPRITRPAGGGSNGPGNQPAGQPNTPGNQPVGQPSNGQPNRPGNPAQGQNNGNPATGQPFNGQPNRPGNPTQGQNNGNPAAGQPSNGQPNHPGTPGAPASGAQSPNNAQPYHPVNQTGRPQVQGGQSTVQPSRPGNAPGSGTPGNRPNQGGQQQPLRPQPRGQQTTQQRGGQPLTPQQKAAQQRLQQSKNNGRPASDSGRFRRPGN